MKKTYSVVQGAIASSGNGDYITMGEFSNLKEAKKYFNSIKKDKRDWASTQHKVLRTEIISDDEDGDIEVFASYEEAF